MELAGTYEYDESFAEQIAEALNKSYSDKASMHAYHTVYAHIFKDMNVENFLEIGLFLNDLQHTDLTAWEEIFPSANLYGADMKINQLFDRGSIQMSYVDQNNIESLNALLEKFSVEFDVILDDASHMYGSTICTFEQLFPALRTGGVYLIEDCQADHPDINGWQQTVPALSEYFQSNGYIFKVFQARPTEKLVDPETNELTEVDTCSDDYIFCIYK